MARQTDKPQYLLRQTHFWKSSGKKVFQNAGILHIFKCASRHSRVSFFNIGSSKSGPYPSVFSHFDLQRRFAPQWACQIGSSKIGAAMRTYKCAWRHNGVPFFQIGSSKMAPRLRCLVHFDLHMCFAPPAACHFSVLKTQGFATFRTCGACVSSFYWLFSRVDLLSTGLTSLLCFSTVWLDFSTLLFNCPYWIVGN